MWRSLIILARVLLVQWFHYTPVRRVTWSREEVKKMKNYIVHFTKLTVKTSKEMDQSLKEDMSVF